ncbi:MAG: hypothetical protein AB1306_10660 [Nitrospirota bacterium]
MARPLRIEYEGQGILGEDEFIKRYLNHVKGYEEVKEIPKGQRYIGRLVLAELLKGTKGTKQISIKAKEAVVKIWIQPERGC